MFMWSKLHDLAAPRGDGLRTEILELIAGRQALGSGNVEDISAYLIDHFAQAGPVPVGKLGGELPEDVLPFRKPEQQPANEIRSNRKIRGNRMYIAMNRFKVQNGSEEAFEDVWRNRDSSLAQMKGFREFHLLRGPATEAEGFTLFASHTVWESHDDFVAWTKSENFRAAHRNAGTTKVHYLGHPQFEGFTTVEGA